MFSTRSPAMRKIASSASSSTGATTGPRPSTSMASKRFNTTASEASSSSASASAATTKQRFSIKNLSRFDQFLACVVFSCAGSAAVWVVRPTIKAISNSPAFKSEDGQPFFPSDAGFINGPMSYRFLYIMIMWPSYTVILYTMGCIFQRREFFAYFVCKMWGRFLPASATLKLKKLLGAPLN